MDLRLISKQHLVLGAGAVDEETVEKQLYFEHCV
jgi:hypothetical protein